MGWTSLPAGGSQRASFQVLHHSGDGKLRWPQEETFQLSFPFVAPQVLGDLWSNKTGAFSKMLLEMVT